MTIQDAIENAKKLLNKENFYDWSLVIYILRDYPEVAKLDLLDLAWAYSKDPSTTKHEAENFIKTLEKRLEEK
jgi:hypothetical protein